ncbi:MAG: hypothetical protein R3C28_24380 [Pirellulaceae bacterium]
MILWLCLRQGEYEDGIVGNSVWETGDWNGDGRFSTSDFVTAFEAGGFEQGPRGGVAAVPEPTGNAGVRCIGNGRRRGTRRSSAFRRIDSKDALA